MSQSTKSVPWTLRHLRLMTMLESGSLIALVCIAMPLKYFADMPEAVSLVGPIHGVFFLWMCGILFLTLIRKYLPLHHGAFVFVAAFVPFAGIGSHMLVRKAVSRYA